MAASRSGPRSDPKGSPQPQRRSRGEVLPRTLSQGTLRHVRTQNSLTRSDLPSRVVSVSIAHLLAIYFLPLVPLLGILLLYLCAEVGCIAAQARSNQGSRMAAFLLLVSGFSCAALLSALSLALVAHPSPVAATLSVAILVTALSHCIIVRTAWIPLGLVTALPLVVGLVLVTLDLVPVAEIAPVELAIGATALAIGAIYVGKGIWEMSTTRQRLMEANEAVQAASQERGRFFAAVSHELRTPLSAICGMAELIAENEAPELFRERSNLLLRSARSLNAIVGDVLDEARLAAGKHVLRPRVAELRSEIEDVVRLFQPEAAAKGMELRLELSLRVPQQARFDPQKTGQVVSNLVSNAIKYSKKGAIEVRVDAHRRQNGWRLIVEVADTGPGVDDAARRTLFREYERLGADAAEAPGTGLGLSISRRFARMMGGDIEVESEPGRGSVFRFTAHIFTAGGTVATQKAATQEPVYADAARSSTDHAETPAGGPAILIVDDTATNRYVARAYLRDFAGRIDEAGNGREALDLIARNRYDAMLLDLDMPVLDGPATIRELRSGPSSSLPVIVLTASTGAADASGRYLVPQVQDVSAVLEKSVRKDRLIATIRSVTEARPIPVKSEARRPMLGAGQHQQDAPHTAAG